MQLKSDSNLPKEITFFNKSFLKMIKNAFYFILTLSVPIPDEEKKLS